MTWQVHRCVHPALERVGLVSEDWAVPCLGLALLPLLVSAPALVEAARPETGVFRAALCVTRELDALVFAVWSSGGRPRRSLGVAGGKHLPPVDFCVLLFPITLV